MNIDTFTCTACKCVVPLKFQVRTHGYCYMCDPAVTLAECLSDEPLPTLSMTHHDIMRHRADWKTTAPHIAWLDGTVTDVATRPVFQSHLVYVAQQLVGFEPTEELARHFAEAEAKRRKYKEVAK